MGTRSIGFWSNTLTSALPQKVAPKNFQNGIWKWPQQMPQRSKRAFGQAASKKIPQKPCLEPTNCFPKSKRLEFLKINPWVLCYYSKTSITLGILLAFLNLCKAFLLTLYVSQGLVRLVLGLSTRSSIAVAEPWGKMICRCILLVIGTVHVTATTCDCNQALAKRVNT